MTVSALAADVPLRDAAATTLRRAVDFFSNHLAVEGTYLWRYSDDGSKREGEGIATRTEGWVQPPGTPAVGLAVLAAWDATRDEVYIHAARKTARGLIRGQLRSGGWAHSIDFSPERRRRIAYRFDGGESGRNVTTLDDDSTQCAMRFLIRMDHALNFQDDAIREAVEYALSAILDAQYPNGAWPQAFEGPADSSASTVIRATMPETWSRTWPGARQYWRFYTLNDNALPTLVETLLLAQEIYGDGAAGPRLRQLAARCRAAAEKAGEFLILAQLPDPQPGWAQQYDLSMHPTWARRFEPPAVTGGEARSVLATLLSLYRETGRKGFLAPIQSALDYYRRSRLPDGRLARFYELGSNRPLYFTQDYRLTYDDRDVPAHYSFKVADWTDVIQRDLDQSRAIAANDSREERKLSETPERLIQLAEEAKLIIASQDARGRWLESGGLRYHKDPSARVINTATFNRNVQTLSRYLAITRRDGLTTSPGSDPNL
jgi:PelA/Pel-15E family pectate lyase